MLDKQIIQSDDVTSNDVQLDFDQLDHKSQILLMLDRGVQHPHSSCHPLFKQAFFITVTNEQGKRQSVIDVRLTLALLKKAKNLVRSTLANGGHALFVGSKPGISELIKAAAARSGQYWAAERWVGGTLTNFSSTVEQRMQKSVQLIEDSEDKETFTKDERNLFTKEHKRTAKFISGFVENEHRAQIRGLPKLVIIVDPVAEKVAIDEVIACRKRQSNISMIVFGDCCNMDFNPRCLDPTKDILVPGNDDTDTSVEVFTHVLANEILAVTDKRKSVGASLESQMLEERSEDESN
jgi:small subunit ribosomal protein S2